MSFALNTQGQVYRLTLGVIGCASGRSEGVENAVSLRQRLISGINNRSGQIDLQILDRIGGQRKDRFTNFCLQHLYGSVVITAPKKHDLSQTRAAIAAPVTPAARVRRFKTDDGPTGAA